MSRALSFVAFACLVGSPMLIGCPQDPPPPPPPVKQSLTKQASRPAAPPPAAKAPPAAGGEVAAGKQLFMRACANCHGVDGTGQAMRQALPKIGNLTSADMHARMKDEDIAALVAKGRGKMPGFGSMLKPEQVQQIIAYVRTMKKQ